MGAGMKYVNAYDVLPQEVIDQVRRFTRGLVYFPNKRPATPERDQAIRVLQAKGEPVRQIARTYGLMERRIYQILGRNREAE